MMDYEQIASVIGLDRKDVSVLYDRGKAGSRELNDTFSQSEFNMVLDKLGALKKSGYWKE